MLKSKKEDVIHNVDESLRKGQKPTEVAVLYDKWAADDVYDVQFQKDVYKGPIVMAREIAQCYTAEQRATARVIDVAAGTGLCAVYLKEHGFKHIDALDPSQGMLDKAKKKNLYERYICDFITDNPLQNIAENTYDILTLSGAVGESHVPSSAMYEMVRLVKPGGRVAIALRDAHIVNIETVMQQLRKEGKWKLMKYEVFPNYLKEMDGIILIFMIC